MLPRVIAGPAGCFMPARYRKRLLVENLVGKLSMR
jgi:hypothetical protein